MYSRNGRPYCMVCFISLLIILWRHRGSGNNVLLFVVRVSMRRIFCLGYYTNRSRTFKYIINFVFGYKTKFDSEKILKHDRLKMIPKWTYSRSLCINVEHDVYGRPVAQCYVVKPLLKMSCARVAKSGHNAIWCIVLNYRLENVIMTPCRLYRSVGYLKGFLALISLHTHTHTHTHTHSHTHTLSLSLSLSLTHTYTYIYIYIYIYIYNSKIFLKFPFLTHCIISMVLSMGPKE